MSSIHSPVARRRVNDARPALRALVAVAGLIALVFAHGARAEDAAGPAGEAPSQLAAPEGVAKVLDNEQCLLCHGVKNMRSGPKALPVPFIDTKVHEASAHNETQCVECHVGVDNDHHPNGVPEPECGYCHEQADEEHLTSVHGQGRTKGVEDVPGCRDCHGTHGIFPTKNPLSKGYPLNLPDT